MKKNTIMKYFFMLMILPLAFTCYTTLVLAETLSEITNNISNAVNADGTANTTAVNAPMNLSRDGIYGCSGITTHVGKQHAEGTFVPVSEEAVALNTYILVNKFCVLDALNNRQREAVVSGLLRATVTGINSGKDGRPQYSQNIPKEQQEIADNVVQKFMNDESLNNICAPYKDSVKQTVLKNYQAKTRKQTETYSCKFPGSADQMQKLLEGNLDEGGGFQALLSLVQSGNDPLSAYNYANETLYRAIQSAQEEEMRQLEWGNGFRSQKECVQVPIGNGETEEQCDIVTPGKVIAEMASYVSQTGFRQTENADSIDELLGGYITNFQNQVVSSFSGFKGTSEDRNGQQSYLDRTAQDSAWHANIQVTNTAVTALNISTASETQYLSVRNATKAIIDAFITKLRQLEDNCHTLMINKAKAETKKKLEDRICGATNGGSLTGGGTSATNFGTCSASVNDTVTDAPGSTEENTKKYHTIVAQSGSETETVKLLVTRDKSNAAVNSEIGSLRTVIDTSIAKAEEAKTALVNLNNMIANNNSLRNFAITQINQLKASGILHTPADVQSANAQKTQVNDALNLSYDQIKTSWENGWCKEEKWVDLKVN